jgi:heme A synthase
VSAVGVRFAMQHDWFEVTFGGDQDLGADLYGAMRVGAPFRESGLVFALVILCTMVLQARRPRRVSAIVNAIAGVVLGAFIGMAYAVPSLVTRTRHPHIAANIGLALGVLASASTMSLAWLDLRANPLDDAAASRRRGE